jgi:hypothetical protein
MIERRVPFVISRFTESLEIPNIAATSPVPNARRISRADPRTIFDVICLHPPAFGFRAIILDVAFRVSYLFSVDFYGNENATEKNGVEVPAAPGELVGVLA